MIAALAEELHAFVPLVDARHVARRDRRCLDARLAGPHGDADVLFVRTGIGAKRAERETAAALERYDVGAVIAVGFAGGLDPSLATGDVVVADPVKVLGDPPCELRAAAQLLAAASNLAVRRGRVLSGESVIRTSAEKRRLGSEHDALAIEMEFAGIARAVGDVPTIYLRAILDDAGLDLPLDFSRVVDGDGRLRPLRMAAALLRHPGAVAGLLDLRRRVETASRALAACVAELVTALQPEESDRDD